MLSLALMLVLGGLRSLMNDDDRAAASPISITSSDLISAPPRGTAEGVLAWARANGAARMTDLTDYVYEVYRLAPIVGIDPAIVIAQSAIETANWTSYYWGNFLNPAGIGIEYAGAPSYRWTSGTNAARFQITLLYIYVNGPIPKGHILYPYLALGPGWTGPIEAGFAGKVKRVNDLSGRWAVDFAYGTHIANRGNEVYKGVAPTTNPPNQTIFNAVSNAGNDPSRVLDGNLSTSWAILGDGVNPAKPGYLQLDLGAKTRLSSIGWVFRATGYADRMRIRVSEDGITYTTIYTTGNAPANAWQAIALDRVARYVRFKLDNPNGDLNLGYIAEVRLYGAANEPTPTTVPKTPTPTPIPTATNVALSASGGSKEATFTGRIRDGSLATDWRTTSATAPASGYVYVDLGRVMAIDSVAWVFSQTGGAPQLDIQLSNDKQSWTTVATASDAPAGSWQSATIGADARYVRWLFTNTTGVPVLGYLAEVSVRPKLELGAPDQPALTPTPTATNLPLSASGGSKNATFTGRIRDGSRATDWRTTASPAPASAYVYLDLGAATYLDSVSWVFSQTGGSPQLDIQISSDKQTWVTVATASDAPAGAWQSAAVNAEARYVRWLFTNSTNVPVLGYLAEVSVRPGSPATPTATSTATPTVTPPPTGTVAVTETATATTAPLVDASALPEGTPIANVASSDSAGSGSDPLAYDGLVETAWQSSGSVGESLQLDLGQSYALSSVGWLFNQANCVETISVEGSLDGVSWTPLATAGPASPYVWQAASVSGSARYLRWSVINTAGMPPQGCLAEVSAWGTLDQTLSTETPVPATETPTETPLPPTETPTETVPDTPTAIPTDVPLPTETPTLLPEEPTEPPTEVPTEAVVQG